MVSVRLAPAYAIRMSCRPCDALREEPAAGACVAPLHWGGVIRRMSANALRGKRLLAFYFGHGTRGARILRASHPRVNEIEVGKVRETANDPVRRVPWRRLEKKKPRQWSDIA